MAFQYTREILDLGTIDDCWVCLEPIDLKNNKQDCVICDNGHRVHRHCYDDLPSKVCGICRAPITKNCYTNIYGYGYTPRTGTEKQQKQSVGARTTTSESASYLKKLPRGGRRTRTRTSSRKSRKSRKGRSNKRKK